MPTRRERLLESLAKEDRKADIKRLRKAENYLEAAQISLEKELHDRKSEDVISRVRIVITDCRTEVGGQVVDLETRN